MRPLTSSRYRRWLLTAVAPLVLAVAAFALGAGGGAHAAQAAPDVAVSVGDLWFCDATHDLGGGGTTCDTAIAVGETVTWSWVGAQPHSVTECGANWGSFDGVSNCTGAAWSSPAQTSGSFQRTFSTPGTFYYLCEVHPGNMRGRVIVQGPTATPTTAPPTATGTSPPAATHTPAATRTPTATGTPAPTATATPALLTGTPTPAVTVLPVLETGEAGEQARALPATGGGGSGGAPWPKAAAALTAAAGAVSLVVAWGMKKRASLAQSGKH